MTRSQSGIRLTGYRALDAKKSGIVIAWPMPEWLRVISHVNPLTYEVSALRGLLIGQPTNYWLDFGVLTVAAIAGICAAASLMGRLAR